MIRVVDYGNTRTNRQVEHPRSVPRTRITNRRLTQIVPTYLVCTTRIRNPGLARHSACRGIPRFSDHANLIARGRQTEIVSSHSETLVLLDALHVDYIE